MIFQVLRMFYDYCETKFDIHLGLQYQTSNVRKIPLESAFSSNTQEN